MAAPTSLLRLSAALGHLEGCRRDAVWVFEVAVHITDAIIVQAPDLAPVSGPMDDLDLVQVLAGVVIINLVARVLPRVLVLFSAAEE